MDARKLVAELQKGRSVPWEFYVVRAITILVLSGAGYLALAFVRGAL